MAKAKAKPVEICWTASFVALTLHQLVTLMQNYSSNNSLKDITQEEADTLLILYAVAVSRQGNTVLYNDILVRLRWLVNSSKLELYLSI